MRIHAVAVLCSVAGCARTPARPTAPTPTPTMAAARATCPIAMVTPLVPTGTYPYVAASRPSCRIAGPPFALFSECPGTGCAHPCRSERGTLGRAPTYVVSYEYDAGGHLVGFRNEIVPAGVMEKGLRYEYRDGKLVAMTHHKHTTRLRYDGDRLIATESDAGYRTRYTYDAAGRMTSDVFTEPEGQTSTTPYVYAPDGKLRTHGSGDTTWTYTYDGDRAVRASAEGATYLYTYRPDGRFDSIEIQYADERPVRLSYRYDDQGRLVEETLTGGDNRDGEGEYERHYYDCSAPADEEAR